MGGESSAAGHCLGWIELGKRDCERMSLVSIAFRFQCLRMKLRDLNARRWGRGETKQAVYLSRIIFKRQNNSGNVSVESVKTLV